MGEKKKVSQNKLVSNETKMNKFKCPSRFIYLEFNEEDELAVCETNQKKKQSN